MRAAIYIRVSTDEQATDGYSIEAQKHKLLAYCDSQDWIPVYTLIDDGFSAKDLKRPKMQELIRLANNKEFDVLLVYKLDRLTRSVTDCDKLFSMFDKLEIKFQSATESFETRTATGRLFLRLVADMAQWERETIAERVRFGIEQMVLEGKKPGGNLPYGYEKTGKLIKNEADIIRQVKNLFLRGLGYKSIANQMNKSGILRRGRFWSDATVQYTLENPFYAGIIRLGKKTKDGKYINWNKDERLDCIYGKGNHEKIFTQEEYDEIKTHIKMRKKGGAYSKKNIYWFSGVLKCGKCGASMFGRLNTKKTTLYYICSNRHHKKICDLPMFRQTHVEYLLLKHLKEIKLNEERLIKNPDKNKRIEEINNTKSQLKQIEARKKKFQYMFVNDLIGVDDLRLRLAEEEEEINILNNKLNDLQLIKKEEINLDKAINLLQIWIDFDDISKKNFVLSLFGNITINTDLINPKGVKNKFFDSRIDRIYFN